MKPASKTLLIALASYFNVIRKPGHNPNPKQVQQARALVSHVRAEARNKK